MTVLIVEDESAVVSMWTSFLRDVAKQPVRVAGDLAEGLRLMRVEPLPEIVLLDLKLPGSNPMNTLAHIADFREINPRAAIIVITGNVDEKMPELAEQFGADAFGRKPENACSQNRLLEVIKNGLARVTGRDRKYVAGLEMLEKLTDIVVCKEQADGIKE